MEEYDIDPREDSIDGIAHVTIGDDEVRSTMPLFMREQVAESLRRVIVSGVTKEVGRPVFGVCYNDDKFAAGVVPYYVVEDRDTLEKEYRSMFGSKRAADFMRHDKTISVIVSDPEMMARPAAVMMSFLLLMLLDDKIRQLVLSVNLSKYDPVLVVKPQRVRSMELIGFLAQVMLLPLNTGPVLFMDAKPEP